MLSNGDVWKYRTRARKWLREQGITCSDVARLLAESGDGVPRRWEAHTLRALIAAARWVREDRPERFRVIVAAPVGVVLVTDTPDGVVRVFLSGVPWALAAKALGSEHRNVLRDEIEAEDGAVCWLRVVDDAGSIALDPCEGDEAEEAEALKSPGVVDALVAAAATLWALVKPRQAAQADEEGAACQA